MDNASLQPSPASLKARRPPGSDTRAVPFTRQGDSSGAFAAQSTVSMSHPQFAVVVTGIMSVSVPMSILPIKLNCRNAVIIAGLFRSNRRRPETGFLTRIAEGDDGPAPKFPDSSTIDSPANHLYI